MRVLVVDDDASIRSMLRSIVEDQGSEVVGEAADGREAIEASKRLKPDLVLLDISMPNMGGFPAARHLGLNCPECPFIFVSQHRDRFYLDAAMECGAKGYIVKSAAVTELPMALLAFRTGEVYQSNLIK
jgi:DNA-binding NarL/FixJ family response regulator